MKHAVRFVIAMVAVILVASSASAQTMSSIGTVKIDFPFTAAGKALRAGTYRFEAATAGTTISIRSTDGDSVNLPVITRLGRHDSDQGVEVVFDVIKSERFLSEIWPPSGADGYCVATNTADHTHYVLGGSKASK